MIEADGAAFSLCAAVACIIAAIAAGFSSADLIRSSTVGGPGRPMESEFPCR